MVLKTRPPIQHEKGAISAYSGVSFGRDALGNGIWLCAAAGAPTSGAAGDGATWMAKGSVYVDTTAGKAYINTGTLASPTWTVVGAQS